MAKKNKGFIPLWRDLQDHWIWKRPDPFDYRSAWVDILMSVNHEERKISVDGRVQVIRPGEMWTSITILANRWHWSRPKVYRYIKLLKMDGMINTNGTPSGTLLTVVNYSNFALQGNTNVTTDVTSGVTTTVTTDVTQTRMIENVNNGENVDIKDPSVCPGYGWYWHEAKQKWIAPPKEGGEWQ